MTAIVLNIESIISDPQIRSGRPVIAGTTLCVSDLVAYSIYGGLSPEELAVSFKLGLGQVHAALAYYFLHQDEIEAEMQESREIADRAMQELEKQGRLIRFG